MIQLFINNIYIQFKFLLNVSSILQGVCVRVEAMLWRTRETNNLRLISSGVFYVAYPFVLMYNIKITMLRENNVQK